MRISFSSVQLYLLATALTLVACTSNDKNPDRNPEQPDLHTSLNSLDWIGTYKGQLPCADCEYIDTRLTLNEDMTYSITSIYVGKDDDQSFIDSGAFESVSDGNTIRLLGIPDNHSPSVYKVEENRLRQLDMEGNVITGVLADLYVLMKIID
jgi:copper homeostasis protein (lipoprotein)